MKLLVVIPSLTRGGAERVVALLTQAWASQHHVQIVLFNVRGQAYPVAGKIFDLDAEASRGAWSKCSLFFIRIFRLALLFRREKPDRIFTFMESANLPSVVAANIVGMSSRLVVSVHDNPDVFPLHYRFFMPIFYRFTKHVVPVSAGIGEKLNRMGVPEDKLKPIPNPIDLISWDDSNESFNKNNTIWIKYSPYFLSVGRLETQKGFDMLIDSFSRLTDYSLNLVILGEGSERDNLEKKIKRLGLESRVFMPGPVINPADAYRSALCYVLSSRHEGWPMVLMEAMACKCPVLAFACNYGPSEIIEDGKSGLLVSPGDVDDLIEKMQIILGNQSLRERLIDEGRRRVETFRLERIAPIWLE